MEGSLSSWYREAFERSERQEGRSALDEVLGLEPEDGDGVPPRGAGVLLELKTGAIGSAPKKRRVSLTAEEPSGGGDSRESSADGLPLDWAGLPNPDRDRDRDDPRDEEARASRRRRLVAALERDQGEDTAHLPRGERRYPWISEEGRRDAALRRPSDPSYDPITLHVPAEALRAMTAFCRQFWRLKSTRMDLVLFVQHGSFYNLFDVDCDVGLRVGLNLSGRRTPNMWKCGCNAGCFEHWSGRVLGLGLSVGRVEETREKGPDGILRRELVEVLTPGTAEGRLLCASQCAEGDAHGVCALDALAGRILVGEFRDDPEGTALSAACTAFSPSEVVLERGVVRPGAVAALRQSSTGAALTRLPEDPRREAASMCGGDLGSRREAAAEFTRRIGERYFRDGVQPGRRGASPSDLCLGKPLASAALACLVRYLEDLGIAADLLPCCQLEPLPAPGACPREMYLDDRVLRHLHLLEGSEGTEAGSLVHLLDGTASAAGGRLLREWVRRPLRRPGDIEGRLDAADHLAMKPKACQEYQHAISATPDFEGLLPKCLRALSAAAGQGVWRGERVTEPRAGWCVCAAPPGEGGPTQAQVAPVMRLLEGLATLVDAAAAFSERVGLAPQGAPDLIEWLPRAAASASRPLGRLLRLFSPSDFVDKAAPFAPANGVSPAFDEAVAAAAEADAALELNPDDPEVQARADECAARRGAALTSFLLEALAILSDSHAAFVELVRAAATSDVLAGFGARIRDLESRGGFFCRPTVLDDAHRDGNPALLLRGAWHPLLTLYLPPRDVVRNDLDLGCGGGECESPHSSRNNATSGTLVLTGPNMGGKSTLLRLSALCAVMAQLGCRAPCLEMAFTPFDRVFTRMGAEDMLVEGRSTFLVELQDAARALDHATRRSLVILDELGRGTSTHDGVAIAGGVLRYLHRNTRCLCLFATHYPSLCLPELGLGHMALDAEADEDDRVPTFLLRPGRAPRGSCGIALARRAGLPAQVLRRAAQISSANE